MRIYRSLAFLLLVLPLPARAALHPLGTPLVIDEETFCSFVTDVEVTATPRGAFNVVWVDDGDSMVKGQRFLRNLQTTGGERLLLPLHGGLDFFEFAGTWAGRYELALNAVDTGTNPAPTSRWRRWSPPRTPPPTVFIRRRW